jgi:hypothetical protein
MFLLQRSNELIRIVNKQIGGEGWSHGFAVTTVGMLRMLLREGFSRFARASGFARLSNRG